MGFTSGLVGGFALTASMLYLSVAVHRQNRRYQSTLLRQQVFLLNSILEPLPEPAWTPRYVVARPSFVETFKDGWNAQITTLVRSLQQTDWADVRERVETGLWEMRDRMKKS